MKFLHKITTNKIDERASYFRQVVLNLTGIKFLLTRGIVGEKIKTG